MLHPFVLISFLRNWMSPDFYFLCTATINVMMNQPRTVSLFILASFKGPATNMCLLVMTALRSNHPTNRGSEYKIEQYSLTQRLSSQCGHEQISEITVFNVYF